MVTNVVYFVAIFYSILVIVEIKDGGESKCKKYDQSYIVFVCSTYSLRIIQFVFLSVII